MSKTRIASGVAAAAIAIVSPFIIKYEGESLEAYKDPVGIWTICHGETFNVTPGMVKTKEECDEITKERIGQFMAEVGELLTIELPPETLAAHTSFAYNIGTGAYSRSYALKKTNTGDIVGGCKAMLNWYTAGGRDCRIKSNNCYGLVIRRQNEVKLCLSGLE